MIDSHTVQTGDEVTWRSGPHENVSTVAYAVTGACCVFTQPGGVLPVPWPDVIAHRPQGQRHESTGRLERGDGTCGT